MSPGSALSRRSVRARQALAMAFPVVVLACLASTIALVFWPGHMDPDTFTEYDQALSGQYTDWHAPIMSAIWGAALDLGLVSPGWVLLASCFGFLVGLYLCLRVAVATTSIALAMTALIAVSPPVLGYLGHVGKDTWFAALLLLLFGLLSRAAAANGRRRGTLLALAIIAAWLLTASRLNAPPATLVAACAGALVVACGAPADGAGRRGRCGCRRRLVAIAAGCAVAITSVTTVRVATYEVLGATRSHPEQTLYLYDLFQLSARTGEVLVPPEIFPAQDLALVRANIRPETADPLLWLGGSVRIPVTEEQVTDLRRAWLTAIRDDPRGYAIIRGQRWIRQVSLAARSVNVYHPGIYPDPRTFGLTRPELVRLGFKYPAAHDLALAYLNVFTTRVHVTGGVVHTVWPYQLALVAGALTFIRRRTAQERVLGSAFVAALAYESAYLVLAPTTFYRYSYASVVLGLVAMVALISSMTAALRRPDQAPVDAT